MLKISGHKALPVIAMIFAMMLMACVAGCQSHGESWQSLSQAEEVIETHPDSALAILRRIPTETLNGKEERARYALLMSMALDKNYIDTTTFDVLRPAQDYYLRHGTPDERLRTLYYQGVIYHNRGEDDAAMGSFLKACDLRNEITDSLTLARTLVAQGVMYYKQYKTAKLVEKNIEAARIYENLGAVLPAVRCYSRALNGCVIMRDTDAVDSLTAICESLIDDCPERPDAYFDARFSKIVELDSGDVVKNFILKNENRELSKDSKYHLAVGYSKIGEHEKALRLLSEIPFDPDTRDSLQHLAIEYDILQRQSRYKEALESYLKFSVISERNQLRLNNDDLLFADRRHRIEIDNLRALRHRDRIIWGVSGCACILILLSGLLYYRYRYHKTRRETAEKDRTMLAIEVAGLESEKEELEELLEKQAEIERPVREAIRKRLDMLNGIIAREITQDSYYSKEFDNMIRKVRSDKEEFMAITREGFRSSHPGFIEHLEEQGLTTDEISLLCLNAIGLRTKDIGRYMSRSGHYNMSSSIRRKLGLESRDIKLNAYISDLLTRYSRM